MPTAVAKNTVYLVVASIAQKLFSFIYFTLIARFLGVEGTGMYVTALSFSTLFSIAVDLGLTSVLIREGAKDNSRLPKILGNTLLIKISLAVMAYLALNLVAWGIGYPSAIRELIWLAGIIMIMDSVSLSFYGVLRARHNLWYEAWGVIIGQVVIVASGVIILYSGGTVIWLLLSLVLGSLFNLLWSSYALTIRAGLRWNLAPDKVLLRLLIRLALPFALAGIFTKVYSYIDTVMLSRFLGSREVGWYSVPYKVGFAFQFIPMAFAAALYPAMSTFFVQDKKRLQGLFEKGIIYLSLLALPISMALVALADVFVIKIFGLQYQPSILPLKILAASLIFAFLDFPIGSLLNACNRQSVQTAAMGVTMVANIIANWILIPRYGVVGAAAAALFGNFLLFFIGALWAPKIILIPSRDLWQKLIKILLASIIMGIALAAIKQPLDSFITFAGAAGTVLYFGALISFGFLIFAGLILGSRAVKLAEIKEIIGLFRKKTDLIESLD